MRLLKIKPGKRKFVHGLPRVPEIGFWFWILFIFTNWQTVVCTNMNNTTAAFDPAAAAASIETMNNILAPLTPLGRHLLASVGLLVGFFALLVGKIITV